jgi:hypothetical protein
MRLEQRGLIRATWGVTENSRSARYYEITAAGTGGRGDRRKCDGACPSRFFAAATEPLFIFNRR